MRLYRLSSLASIAAMALVAGAAAQAASNTDPVVMTVGSEHLTASQFNALLQTMPAERRAVALAHKREVAQQYAQLLALDEEAHKRGLDKTAEFKAEVRLARQQTLADALLQQLQDQNKPSPGQVEAYYDAHRAEYERAKVAHILVSYQGATNSTSKLTKAEAQAKINGIAAQLKAGADFAALAKADSDDTGSKDRGGELGEISRGMTVPEFEKVAFSLPVGQVSPPFESPFGFHILKVEARGTQPLAAVQASISSQLQRAAQSAAVGQILAANPPVLNPSFFPAPPAPAPGSGAAPATDHPAPSSAGKR